MSAVIQELYILYALDVRQNKMLKKHPELIWLIGH